MFRLPQAFLIRKTTCFAGKKIAKEETQRIYLGDYHTIQYMEDSNLLDQIIAPKMEDLEMISNMKYRIYQGIPIWRFSKSRVAKHRASINFGSKVSSPPTNVHIFCNYEDPKSTEAHLIL